MTNVPSVKNWISANSHRWSCKKSRNFSTGANFSLKMSQFKCNLCLQPLYLFSESSPQKPKSFLSECMRHIFCELCVNKLKPYCACKRKTRFMEIREQMPAKFRVMFENPDNIRKQMYSVNKFQMDHYQWNSKEIIKRILKYKQEGNKMDEQRAYFISAIRQLKERNDKLSLMIREGMKHR